MTVLLAGVPDVGLVPAAIAQALGIRQGADRSLRDSLATALATRPTLLLLDNLEHLLPAKPLIDDLLASCPDLKIIATSRVRLRLHEEREFPVSPLALPEAGDRDDVQLVERSSAVGSSSNVPWESRQSSH